MERRLYSWWWDSHISPKNSKWLQENLADMDAKVKAMIKLIEEDADSFARRAEMYYKRRPELMKLVEEFYRAYRALAERYDHATSELRHAHRTMAEAFPGQIPFVLDEVEPHVTEMPHPIRAFLGPDGLHKDALGFSISNLNADKDNVPYSGESESERGGQAEKEAQRLKKALADLQAEKEAVLIRYQQCLEKLSSLEGELNRAQKDSMRFNEQARTAETEVQTLKEVHVKLEAERDAGFSQHKECLERISNMDDVVSKAQEDARGLNERTIKAEIEAQYLKNECSRLESENEAGLLQYRQCLEKISCFERKLSVSEEDARLLNDRADRAEVEVKHLKKTLAELNEERGSVALEYHRCLEKISKLEGEISCSKEEVKHLDSEILIGAAKLMNSEEKCIQLESSNQTLLLEADNLAKKITEKDLELSKKHDELEKLQMCVRDERLHYVQIQATLQNLQNLYSQSQEDQKALALELKNGIRILKDSEICKHGLEEEIQQVKDENQSSDEFNSSSNISMKKLENEILNLREIKERLEEEVSLQMGLSNSLQKEIFQLKEEIKGLNRSYQALMKQVESVGLKPECIGSKVKDLQDENSRLRQICEEEKNEKEAFSKTLEKMEELMQKNAFLESSLSDMSGQLEGSQEKVRALQESREFSNGEKSSLVTEKAALLSQLQIITVTMQKLLEKNTVLETSLSGANLELQGLREKSKCLEEICRLLRNEKSNLHSERGSLVVQLENAEQMLDNLENRFSGMEDKYAALEKENESTHSQIEQIRVSLRAEKQNRASFTLSSENRFGSLGNHAHLLQEESRSRKNDFEGELDEALSAQFEIFILQKFIQDMEEKNFSLLTECQKYVEEYNLTDKLISELENENLEQQVEAEVLLKEIEKLKLRIYQVFKALEIDQNIWSEDKSENDEIFVHHILGNIGNMKCSLSKCMDDNQQLLIENSILLTLLGQLNLEGREIESEKNIRDQELRIMTDRLFIMQDDKQALLQMNRQLRTVLSQGNQKVDMLKTEVDNLCVKQGDLQRVYLELDAKYSQALEENKFLLKKFSDVRDEKCMVEEENDSILLETLSLDILSTILKSFGTDKAAKLESLSQDLKNLYGVNEDLEHEVGILIGNLEMKEKENLFLKDSVERLEMELYGVEEFNDLLKHEISIGKDSLGQREKKLSEAENKVKATQNLNSELCKIVEGLKNECEKSKLVSKNLEKQLLELSEDSTSQNKAIECLRDVNGNLLIELGTIHEEIQERRNEEENLCSELQQKKNDLELWEAEATGFYFDFQISSIREIFFENMVHELTGACTTLENENASKTMEIEQMKERISFVESELEGLKAQLLAYAPVKVFLRDNVASLEHNSLSHTNPDIAENHEAKNAEEAVCPEEKLCKELMEDEHSSTPNGISDFWKLQTRIESVEKVLAEEMNRLNNNVKLEAAMSEIEELKYKCSWGREKGKIKEEKGLAHELGDTLKVQKAKPEISEARHGILMKDIPLDHVSGSLGRENGGAEDQIVELWETAENDYSRVPQEPKYEPTEDDMVDHQSEDVEQRSEYPSSELQIEKELGVDKLELSTGVVTVPNRERNKKLLERLNSDAQKLAILQITVQDFWTTLEKNKKSRKSKHIDIESLKKQLQDIEESVVHLVDFNGQLMKNIEESPLASDSKDLAELEEASNVQRRRVSEKARKGSEKIGRLQLEIEKIQHALLKLDDGKKNKARNRFSRSRTTIILRDFIYKGRRNSAQQKKPRLCGCLRSSTNGDGNHT